MQVQHESLGGATDLSQKVYHQQIVTLIPGQLPVQIEVACC